MSVISFKHPCSRGDRRLKIDILNPYDLFYGGNVSDLFDGSIKNKGIYLKKQVSKGEYFTIAFNCPIQINKVAIYDDNGKECVLFTSDIYGSNDNSNFELIEQQIKIDKTFLNPIKKYKYYRFVPSYSVTFGWNPCISQIDFGINKNLKYLINKNNNLYSIKNTILSQLDESEPTEELCKKDGFDDEQLLNLDKFDGQVKMKYEGKCCDGELFSYKIGDWIKNIKIK